ncbi:NUDIX hydrolase [Xanthocytophaga flava]|uniref:NUDIX hydrolase n=1 Tax=Xanthocytophaga flava TaxID=3048013 RepID=UPI0028D85B7A|nr:NUDIX hydrolase [Xanthocytophaga flavus]MDJ1468611.1 NUDIX hydrolase [Xanthocytophaga flavus]
MFSTSTILPPLTTPDPQPWKVLASEYIAKEPWFTVRKEKVEMPNGSQIASYYVSEFPDWVNVIAVTKDQKIVLVKQYRHGIGKVSYELCAGVCDPTDKSPLESAQRELMEETGYGGGSWQEWMVICPNPSIQTNYTHCFLATDVEWLQEPTLEHTEDITVHLLSKQDVRALLNNNEILQALMAAPLWKYLALFP